MGDALNVEELKSSGSFVEHYVLGPHLGSGSFGLVYKCFLKSDPSKAYAVKTIKKTDSLSQEDIESVYRETKILKCLKGVNHVVQLKDFFDDPSYFMIVLELCHGGELFYRIINKTRYTEKDAAKLVREMLEVIGACHMKGVIHRDLKPENFLFADEQEDSELKIVDFGLSTFYTDRQVFSSLCGTPFYLAPEVLHKKYGSQSDVWSAGVIMFILLCGKPPFFGRANTKIFKMILNSQKHLAKHFQSPVWSQISDEAKDLILCLLNPDPKVRFTPAQALAHPWVMVDGCAPDVPLDIALLSKMKEFRDYSKVTKVVLRNLALTYSDEDIRDIRQQFMLMDRDNTGTISMEELMEAMSKASGPFGSNSDSSALSRKEAQDMLKGMDYNGDGEIDYLEFTTAALRIRQRKKRDSIGWDHRIKLAFSKIDHDGNGYIDLAELRRELEAMGQDPEGIEGIVGKYDENGDGYIDFDEFSHLIRKLSSDNSSAPGMDRMDTG
ncbi:calcium-dependent protein kinase [Chloropicon primus]|uniref:Calcium-dependent protein kinase n=1 Tax=Chloropicon primus TaxID=1764295 RepID=A0A5B8MWY5_9CHLO|nr:calcium-dependent protein kinase [Chloropicon primus]UPR03300.1 calcium-dependent protein kinase [Chloropicon primus]|eukprot:QDZ24092.1 calcium-dependent protein kinase [Chloropicon primus]